MSLVQTLLAEFEQEAKTTRRFLERLPKDRLTWKPHEKSLTAGQLALHLAQTVGNVAQMAMQDTLEVPNFDRPNPQPQSVDEVLQAHDQAVETVRKILPTFSDAALQATWRMVSPAGKEYLAMPRAMLLRMIMMNHWIHHRGQFGVYLRLLGAKVPSSYGPSGDELPDFMGT